jgi:exopolyphosphatase/guanosine-5'-triphosphate,3'-diphosphate pyrophosphatase
MSDFAAALCPDARRPAAAYAALDLGTNNCRLLVGAPAGESFRVLESFSRTVRLGEGLEENGALSEPAMERTLAALRACAARLERRPVRAIRAIATEACRRAANGRAFLRRVREEVGLDISIISSREEVELALESCTPLLHGAGRRALLFDIGGGSTELAWIRLSPRADGAEADPPQLIGYVSLPVGVVTLVERYGDRGLEPAVFHAMVDEVTERLRGFEAIHRIGAEIRQGGVGLLGTSGTVTTLAGIALDLPRYSRPMVDGVVLSAAAAQDALARLRAYGRDGLAAHPCVGPERAEFVMPGCAIFSAIHRLWPAPTVIVADRGLREGMLLRMMRATAGGTGGATATAERARRRRFAEAAFHPPASIAACPLGLAAALPA